MSASADLDAAVREVQVLVSADGAQLIVTSTAADFSAVTFELVLAGADCADCVLPPAMLISVVTQAIRQRAHNHSMVVIIEDPRATQP